MLEHGQHRLEYPQLFHRVLAVLDPHLTTNLFCRLEILVTSNGHYALGEISLSLLINSHGVITIQLNCIFESSYGALP